LNLKKVIVIGLSLGARASLHFAVKYPQLVQNLVLVDISIDANPKGTEKIVQFLSINEEMEFDKFVQRAHQHNPTRSIENLTQRFIYSLRQLSNGKWIWKFDRIGLLTSFSKANYNGNTEPWAQAKLLTCPTLIVRGQMSDVLTVETANKLKETINNSLYVEIPKAGHSVMGDNPEAFAAAIDNFLTRQ